MNEVPIWVGVGLLAFSGAFSMAVLTALIVVIFKQFVKAQHDWAGTREAYMEVVRDLARVIRFMEGGQIQGQGAQASDAGADAAQAMDMSVDRLRQIAEARDRQAREEEDDRVAADVAPGAVFGGTPG